MIRLTLLRGIGLVDASGHSVDAVMRQPKRLAVLAYLALAGRALGCQRDALLALFWPELTTSRARQALNATTHFLRQHLGQDIIVSRGPDALGIASGALWCDAAAFVDSIADDPEGALQLYSGDLLPGFYIDAGHEFDRWLDEERRHLRGLAADAARRLAQRAASERDTPSVSRLARRLVDLADNDEVLVQQAIALMDRASDRSGALDVYSRFASRLSQEYPGARPSAETVAMVERIRSHEPEPARLDDSVADASPHVTPSAISPAPAEQLWENTQLLADTTPITDRTPHAVPAWRAAAGAHRWAVGLVSGVTLTTALLLTAAARSSRKPHATTTPLPRVELAGFTALDHSAASAQAAAVLTEDLTDRLTRTTSLDVVEHRDDGARADGSARRDVPPDLIARGSVARSGTRFVIGVSLVDGREGTTVRTARFESADAVLPTKDTVSIRIAQFVQETLRRQIRLRRVREGLHDERLYRLMQDADEDRQRAEELRGQGHAEAAARALANADTTLAAVERAAPMNGDVRTTRSGLLAVLAVSYLLPPTADPPKLRPTLTQAVAEADTAMLLDSASVDAADAYASAGEAFVSLVPLPADSTARVWAHIERALHHAIALDPLRSAAWTRLSSLLYIRGDFEGAYDAARHAYDTDAFGENGRELLARLSASAYELGDDSAAARWSAEMTRKYPDEWMSALCELRVIAHTAQPTRSTLRDAWQIASAASRLPGADPLIAPRVQMLVATTLAHAGLRDSAEHVIARARASAGADPEMWLFEAEAWAGLDAHMMADSLVRKYVTVMPAHPVGLLRSRQFRPFQRS